MGAHRAGAKILAMLDHSFQRSLFWSLDHISNPNFTSFSLFYSWGKGSGHFQSRSFIRSYQSPKHQGKRALQYSWKIVKILRSALTGLIGQISMTGFFDKWPVNQSLGVKLTARNSRPYHMMLKRAKISKGKYYAFLRPLFCIRKLLRARAHYDKLYCMRRQDFGVFGDGITKPSQDGF